MYVNKQLVLNMNCEFVIWINDFCNIKFSQFSNHTRFFYSALLASFQWKLILTLLDVITCACVYHSIPGNFWNNLEFSSQKWNSAIEKKILMRKFPHQCGTTQIDTLKSYYSQNKRSFSFISILLQLLLFYLKRNETVFANN